MNKDVLQTMNDMVNDFKNILNEEFLESSACFWLQCINDCIDEGLSQERFYRIVRINDTSFFIINDNFEELEFSLSEANSYFDYKNIKNFNPTNLSVVVNKICHDGIRELDNRQFLNYEHQIRMLNDKQLNTELCELVDSLFDDDFNLTIKNQHFNFLKTDNYITARLSDIAFTASLDQDGYLFHKEIVITIKFN